jgi:hypothetical protein
MKQKTTSQKTKALYIYRALQEGPEFNQFAGVDLDTGENVRYELCTSSKKSNPEASGYKLVLTARESRWLPTLRWNGEPVAYTVSELLRSGYMHDDMATIKKLPVAVRPILKFETSIGGMLASTGYFIRNCFANFFGKGHYA